MNWVSYAAKIRREAEKARNKASKACETLGINDERFDPQREYDRVIELGKKQAIADIELAMELMETFRGTRQLTNQPERWYMINIRPPENITWTRFKADWEMFVNKWEHKWIEYCYVYEQKGETEDDLGKGFHVHCRLLTSEENYYPSHINRDLKKIFNYIPVLECRKCESIKNLKRCIEYMQGIKEDPEKEAAVAMDPIWRERVGLPAEVKKNTRLAIEHLNDKE